jgi:predicted histone-like DNA-binding protein
MIKIKAVQRKQLVGKYEGQYRFQMSPETYSALSQSKVIKEAALRSGVSRGVMQACWDAAGEVIKAWATEGHSVALPGLGTMRFGMNAKTCETVEEVKSSLITTRKVVFTPNVELKQELKNTSIKITCYDKDGNLITTVTSDDEGNVEDNEDEGNDNPNDNPNVNQSVEAPVISGNTPFAESTTVSMSGPDDAEIHYTTDGSNPTAESQLYSEPFTLSASANVKAIAIKDGNSSQVSTKDFTKTNGGVSND